MGHFSRYLLLTLSSVFLISVSCTKSNNQNSSHGIISSADSNQIRQISETDALADYDAMISAIRALYGPLEYKERRFGYVFENDAKAIRAKFSSAKSESEKFALFFELLRKLQDGHVSLTQPLSESYKIPMILMPVQGHFLVNKIAKTLAPYGIEQGDEILSVDGMTPEDALKIITKYTWFANAESDRHMIFYFFFRSNFFPELIPTKAFAQIEYVGEDGIKKLARIPWQKTSPQQRDENKKTEEQETAASTIYRNNPLDSKATLSKTMKSILDSSTSIGDMGELAPWYWNSRLQVKYGVTLVTPERARVAAFYPLWVQELEIFEPQPSGTAELPKNLPEVWAALYKYNGKTVLMIRQPSYEAENYAVNLAIYSALISQYQPIADALVIDQTHNPGGAALYTENFARLFAPKGMNGFVQFLNTDRKWYSAVTKWWTSLDKVSATSTVGARVAATIASLDRDSEAGLRLTKDPFNFSMREIMPPAPGGAVWRKPILVLIDELCGSGGDVLPMLLKANGLAKLFGNRTAGLGGSVEKVIDLPFTRASLSLTRGLFTTFKPDGKYTDADFVENSGVTPDIQYTHTVDDVRNGFDGYFNMFSDEATK